MVTATIKRVAASVTTVIGMTIGMMIATTMMMILMVAMAAEAEAQRLSNYAKPLAIFGIRSP